MEERRFWLWRCKIDGGDWLVFRLANDAAVIGVVGAYLLPLCGVLAGKAAGETGWGL